jgi:putative transposase
MTTPRQILRGTTYLLTRRCVGRAMLLAPNEGTNQILSYALAEAATRTGVQVHAFVAMSNHIHVVLTDAHGTISEFMARFHRSIAICMNVKLGRSESFFASSPPASTLVELGDPDAILDMMAYVMTNPVQAGLVRTPAAWPGVITTRLGARIHGRRPSSFRVKGPMPALSSIECTVPPSLRALPRAEVEARLASRIQRRLRTASMRRAADGAPAMGASAVVATAPSRVARRVERPHGRRPRFAASCGKTRRALHDRHSCFQAAYRRALDAWRGGHRLVEFPHGTYFMRVFHGAKCPSADAPLLPLAGDCPGDVPSTPCARPSSRRSPSSRSVCS